MRAGCHVRSRQRGSLMLLYTLALGTVILPMVGLGIDMGYIYLIQARVWAAVDGAALGVGRMLGTGVSDSRYEEIGAEFLNSTFRPGYWNLPTLTSSPQADCDQPASALPPNSYSVRHCIPSVGYHQVKVNVNVQVPVMFLRLMNVDHVTVNTSALATRRDTRVMLVLDRSGSMTGTWTTLQTAAISFTGMFRRGIDRMGLVIYGTTAIVAYPSNYPRPYDPSPNAAGGPDVNFINAADTKMDGTEFNGTGDMLYMIKQTKAGGATGMDEALWTAYIELQKGHMTDLAAGPDGRLNAIVLFTDGYPNQIPVYLNPPAPGVNWLRQPKCPAGNPGTGCSSCNNNPANPAAPATQMIAGMGAPYYPSYTNYPNGDTPANVRNSKCGSNNPCVGQPYQLASIDTASTLSWVQEGGSTDGTLVDNSATSLGGCRAMYGTPVNVVAPYVYYGDLPVIPAADYYGNSTAGTAYENSAPASSSGAPILFYRGTPYNNTSANSDYHWALAVWNAVDNAGFRIRTDANAGIRGDAVIQPTIYTIGYQGNGGVDEGLLKRLANTLDAPPGGPGGYHAQNMLTGQATGKYVPAFQGADIYGAFADVASSILRLSQ